MIFQKSLPILRADLVGLPVSRNVSRNVIYSAVCGVALLVAAASPLAAQDNSGIVTQSAQPAPPPQQQQGDAVRVMVQPALDDVGRMIGTLDTGHWKAPNDVRADTDRNVASIQRDLSDTLPGLLAKTDAAPGSPSAAFAVYRNIDALYDVLLRVEQTAELAGSDREAQAVNAALNRLESSRRQLGDGIATWTGNQESDLAHLHAAMARATTQAAAAAPAKTSVVDDGPQTAAAKPKKKKKPATQTPAAAQPAPASTPQ